MVMYPHTATVSILGASTKDGNGNFTTAAGSDFDVKCRLELNSSNKFLQMADGKRVDFSAILYMPIGTNIPAGAKIKVVDNGTTLIDTTVKQFFKGQLNQKVWL